MRLAVFVSGTGSNFQAILDAIREDRLPARVVVCVSTSETVGAVERARHQGIPTTVLEADRSDETACATEILSILDRYDVDFIALAGFMRRIPSEVVRTYRHRILNIHPALLPAFGGAGMFGRHVHEAVLAYGVRVTGVTVHLVDEEYDTGPIVLQKTVRVEPDDTVETLAARVLRVEHRLYPEALRLFAEDRVRVNERRVLVSDPNEPPP